ncbi:hypothetical protein PYW07_010326 [Mythimna separata]|uniref:Uncharacterized protein n=1 Tax=Mythimna separata TaxID=271217 RepID=A0AAD7Y9Q3_MYTSE|nr:hypothetical protein PYW07_010326 [Mythimna separata]
MEESVCIICNKSDDKQVYEIKKTALNRLVASSKKRIDNRYKKFVTLTSALIHRTCQSHYNDETAIATFCSSRRKKSQEGKQINLIRTLLYLIFNLIAFSAVGFSVIFLKIKFHQFKITIQEKIYYSILKKQNTINDFNKNILARLRNVPDLVAIEAHYHTVCYFV